MEEFPEERIFCFTVGLFEGVCASGGLVYVNGRARLYGRVLEERVASLFIMVTFFN